MVETDVHDAVWHRYSVPVPRAKEADPLCDPNCKPDTVTDAQPELAAFHTLDSDTIAASKENKPSALSGVLSMASNMQQQRTSPDAHMTPFRDVGDVGARGVGRWSSLANQAGHRQEEWLW